MFTPIAVDNLTLPDQSLREFGTFEGQQWMAAMSQLNTTNFEYQTSSVRIGSALSGTTYKYIGAALASNGKIYCPGHNQNRTLAVNTYDNTVAELTGATNTQNSGMFYDKITNFCYASGNGGLKVDCATDTPSNITSGTNRATPTVQSGNGNRGISGAVAFKTAGVYDYNIATNTAALVSASAGYRAGVCISPVNNAVFFGNDTATNYIRFEPATNTLTTFGTITAYRQPSIISYFDGYVYSLPANNGTVIKRINPVTLEVVDIFTPTFENGDGSACIGADGRIYRVFGNNGRVRWYDPRTNTEGLLCTLSNSDVNYSSIRLGVDGSLYCIPRDAAYVHRIAPARGSEYVTNIIKEFNFGGRYCWV